MQIGPDAYNTIEEFRTLPEILAEAGYVCGLSGKWHLGDNLHPQEGFTFWVTKPHGHTARFYDAEVIENGEIRKEPSYLTDYLDRHGIEFIEQNQDRPFFLFLAYNGPYGLGPPWPARPATGTPSTTPTSELTVVPPRGRRIPGLATTGTASATSRPCAEYAAEVSGVDDGVGRVMRDTSSDSASTENTLVIFTADQGLAAGTGLLGHGRPHPAADRV